MADRYLVFRPGRGWYVRVAVPLDLRPMLAPTKGNKPPHAIVKALGTSSKREAIDRAPAAVAAIKATFDRARERRPLSDEEIDRLAAQRMVREYERHHVAAFRDPESFREGYEHLAEAREYGSGPEQNDESLGRRLIREKGAAESHESVARLAEALGRAEMRAMAALCEGSPLPPLPSGLSHGAIRPGDGAGNGSLTFADAAARYIADRMRDPAAGWSAKTRHEIEKTFQLLDGYLGKGVRLAAITRETATGFLDTLGNLHPVYPRSPVAVGKTLAELVGLFPGPPYLSNATLNRHGCALSGLFKWAMNAGLAETNPFANQHRRTAREDRRGFAQFTVEELQALVNSLPPAGALRWVPLAAMYSGMRSGEILGLRVADRRERDGVAFFDVREGEGRTIKTEAARRIVPVHSQLTRFGFLDYVEGHRRQGKTHLFDGPPASSDFSRTFARHLQRHGIKRPRLSMHSLRGNVATALENAGVPEGDAATLLGHEKATLSYGLYSSGLSLARLKEVVEAIRYQDVAIP